MISTLRMTVDLMTVKDAQAVADYYQRNESHLKNWQPARPKGYHEPEAWQSRLELQERDTKAGQSFCFAMRLAGDEQIIGVCNFTNVIRGAFLACYLGYSVDVEKEGEGLMFEALQSMLPHVFKTYGLHRVMANYMPKNERSGRLLTRLGFEKEGYAKSYLKIANMWEDHILTALTDSC